MKQKNLSDTRNKIDDNSHLKQKQKRNSSKNSFKSLKSELSDDSSSVSRKVKAPTKGQLFKLKHGFSRSTYRAMKKVGLAADFPTFEAYKALRRSIKKAARIERAKKRSDSVAIRKYGKDTSKKGKSQKKS